MRRQSRDHLSASSWPAGYASDGPSPFKPAGDAEDLGARIMPEDPGGKGDRGQERFQVAWRQIEQKPPDLAIAHRGEPRGDDLQMPIRSEAGARIERMEGALREGGEVAAQQRVVAGGGKAGPQAARHRPLRGCEGMQVGTKTEKFPLRQSVGLQPTDLFRGEGRGPFLRHS